MKFLEYKTEKIINGIFFGGLIYFVGYILFYLASISTASSLTGHYIAVGMYYLGTFCKPIGILVIFKFLCDLLYKILKALDKYNNEQQYHKADYMLISKGATSIHEPQDMPQNQRTALFADPYGNIHEIFAEIK